MTNRLIGLGHRVSDRPLKFLKGDMYYGFKLAGILWAYYGLTLGMKAGAWGFFAPEISRDVGLSPTEIGLVAGVVMAGTAVFTPIAGLYISRRGCKRSMVLGLFLGAAGLLATSVGTSLYSFAFGAVLLAASTSFSGVVPIQTLTTVWFDRYRSRAMAVIFTATPIWGALSFPLYEAMLSVMTWRAAFAFLTLIFPVGLVLVLAFIKNSPDEIGQPIDGRLDNLRQKPESLKRQTRSTIVGIHGVMPDWTVRSALLSPIFALITLSVAIGTMPYLYLVTYGRLLLDSVSVPMPVAVAALAGLTLATLLGRLSASLADLIDARLLVLGALICNVAGISTILASQLAVMVYVSVFLIGVSFGLSFIIAPLLLADVFGKSIFAPIEGVRMSIVVGFNAALAPLFGYFIEVSNSYLSPLKIILFVNLIAMIGLTIQVAASNRLKSRP